jgi:hypothetical protein
MAAGGVGGAGGGGGGAAADAGAGGADGGPASDAGPIILSLSTNVTALTPNSLSGPLVITAVVTHPLGIAQVIGGTLSDPPMGGTYGAFQVSTVAGSYSLSLSWNQIEQVREIIGPAGGVDRVFRAQFFDQTGHSTSQDITVKLWCGSSSTDALCRGQCENLSNNALFCGSCDNNCGALGSQTCMMGKCVDAGLSSTTRQSCDSLCAASGMTCTAASASYQLNGCAPTLQCSQVPPPNGTCVADAPFEEIDCTCSQ